MIKKNISLLFLFFFYFAFVFAQTSTEFQDPKVFEINKIYPRTNYIIPTDSNSLLSLNGLW